MKDDRKLFEMKVEGLTLDPLSNTPIIMLKESEGDRVLPIWVGVFEANAISLEMEKVETPRPMTHDLIKNILMTIDADVNYVVINDIRANTFYAEISFELNGHIFNIDARPSDAIALALRFDINIFVTENVICEAKGVDELLNVNDEKSDAEKLKNWLDDLSPEDFGKYKH